ncbi:MAG: nitrile hydratase subunit beta [Alphaproteobacteria bacterium]
MDGIHDMGGMHGLGPLVIERDEPVFHHPWEGRIFGLNCAATGDAAWTLDYFRFTRECLPAHDYLSQSYYEQWWSTYAIMFLESGLITALELKAGHAAPGTVRREDAMRPEDVPTRVRMGTSARREVADPPRFAIGQPVRARNVHPAGHTRLPRYVRGRLGRVHAWRGGQVLPDTSAHGQGDCPQHLYSVVFAARELWGPGAAANDKVFLDLWQGYLEPAGG